jgi:hypothetical protein
MHKLLCAVFLGLMAVSCAQHQRVQPASSSVSPNDPRAPAGATAGSSKETGDTQARPDQSQNPADKAPKY